MPTQILPHLLLILNRAPLPLNPDPIIVDQFPALLFVVVVVVVVVVINIDMELK
jgi:hypothetical protein